MSPDKPKCSQCATRLRYTKHADTLAGRLGSLFERVGKVVVIGGASAVLLLVLVGGHYAYIRIRGASSDSDQAASVSTIVDNAFTASAAQSPTFKVVMPPGASNARVVGGYKVTSGRPVNFYILDEAQYGRWAGGDRGVTAVAQRPGSSSVRLRQVLRPGTYYLLFSGADSVNDVSGVAAEFYLKYD